MKKRRKSRDYMTFLILRKLGFRLVTHGEAMDRAIKEFRYLIKMNILEEKLVDNPRIILILIRINNRPLHELPERIRHMWLDRLKKSPSIKSGRMQVEDPFYRSNV